MNETSMDAWFYSREGERIGPVNFAELKIKAAEAGLNPRHDMVWTHGMPEWKPAGEIEGLFERRAAPEIVEGGAPADPYLPPEYDSSESEVSQEGEWPGARRRSFLFAVLVFPFLVNIGIAILTATFEAQLGKETVGLIAAGAMILMVIICIWYSLQRLANLGMSRWWYLANFVPILNLWIGYRCFACPAGYAVHKKLDGIGIALAIFYWLMLLLALLAVGLVIALLVGAAGSPEIQQQIQDVLRQATEAKP